MSNLMIRAFTAAICALVLVNSLVAQPPGRPESPAGAGVPPPGDATLPSLLPPPGSGPSTPGTTTAPPPPHWVAPQPVPGDIPPGDYQPVPMFAGLDLASQGDLYLRLDFGTHKEIGFAEDDGAGLEVFGRLRLPHEPCLSVVGGLRNEFLDNGDRFSWTLGGFGEWGMFRAGGGIDGIRDGRSETHVGSGYLFISYDLPVHCLRVGLWSTFELWDDVDAFSIQLAPNVTQVIRTGVEPYEQTSVFISKHLGPDGRFGEIYFAPGFEHRDGRFRFSVGYQGTIVDQLDGYVHYHQTAEGDRDWTFFAGLQYHIGCGEKRPWDFVMPQRIRPRQTIRTTSDTFVF